MPDDSGKLTQEEKDKVAAWLTDLAKSPGANSTCPLCGSPDWIIADHVVMPVVVGKGGGVMLGGPGYPQVMVVSAKCGHTRFVNAVLAGIVIAAPPPQEKKG